MPKDTVRKTVEFDREFLEWYEHHYGGSSLWWLVNELCHAFKNAHEYTPQQLAVIGAAQVRENIEFQDRKLSKTG